MKNLIIGSQGLVGTALRKCLPDALNGVQVEAKEKNQVYVDLVKYETLFKVFSEYRPQVVYLPASITHVDKCEDMSTNVVNVKGAITVLRLCEQFEAKLIYYSSSYVFDGSMNVPYPTTAYTAPINNYGVQKQTVERTILNSDAKFVIIRTVGVYGEERRKKNFGKQVIACIFAGRQVFAPNDQFMNPILSSDLAHISVKLAEKANGLFHVASDTSVSKYEFARKIARYFNLDHLVVPMTSEEMKQRAARPKMGSLDCSGLTGVGIEVPSFERGILRFLEQEYNG